MIRFPVILIRGRNFSHCLATRSLHKIIPGTLTRGPFFPEESAAAQQMAASRIANIIVRLPFLTFLSFCPGMAESSVLAAGAVKLPYDLPGNMGILLDNHLAYTISVIDGKNPPCRD